MPRMQPEIINYHLYSSFSNDLDKIQKFLKSLSQARGGRVLFQRSVSPWRVTIYLFIYLFRYFFFVI